MEIEDIKPRSILIPRTTMNRATDPFMPWTPFSRALTFETPQDSAGAFSPSDIASLFGWYDANQEVYQDSSFTTPATADGDPVGGWKDLSGNGRHLIQSVDGNRPTLKLGIQNGKNILRFTGTQYMQSVDVYTVATSISVASVVAINWGTLGFNGIFGHNYGATSGQALLPAGATFQDWVSGDLLAIGNGYNIGSAPRAIGPLGPITSNTFQLLAASLGPSVASSWLNGTLISTRVSDTGNCDTTSNYLVVGSTTGVADFLGGDLGELVFATPSITSSQMIRLETYAQIKWNTPALPQ